MTDYLVRMVARDIGVRAVACVTTDLVAEGIRRHRAGPDASQMLAHALTGGALLGALLKVGQRLALKLEGDGPLRKLLVESDSNGNVRGYVARPDMVLPPTIRPDDALHAFGPDGHVKVVKDLRLERLVEGIVALTRSSVAGNLVEYLHRSEQIPSLMAIGIQAGDAGGIQRSGGLLLQAIPPYEDSIFDELQERMEELPPMDALIGAGHSPEEIVALMLADREQKTLVKQSLQFVCSCSYERTRQALIAIGRDEVAQLLETEGEAVIDCNFCGKQYTFSGPELAGLLAEMASAS